MWRVPEPEARPHIAYWADEPYQTLYRRIRDTDTGTVTYAWADMRDVLGVLNLTRDAPELLTDEWHTVQADGDQVYLTRLIEMLATFPEEGTD